MEFPWKRKRLFHALTLHRQPEGTGVDARESIFIIHSKKCKAMRLTLVRTYRQGGYTSGVLFAGEEMMAHTLEPPWRNLRMERKVKGQTAIPEGIYRVVLAPSMRFGRKMPRLLDVPGFKAILIHWGNTVADTQGCILVGRRDKNGTLRDSRRTFEKLYQRLRQAEEAEDSVRLIVQ